MKRGNISYEYHISYLNMSVGREILHQGPVHPGHPSVMNCEPIGQHRQQVLQLEVLDLLCLGSAVLCCLMPWKAGLFIVAILGQ